jgi:hypothetical protein
MARSRHVEVRVPEQSGQMLRLLGYEMNTERVICFYPDPLF